MRQDAESNSEADRKRAESTEAKNNAETNIWQIEKNLDTYKDQLTDAERDEIRTKVPLLILLSFFSLAPSPPPPLRLFLSLLLFLSPLISFRSPPSVPPLTPTTTKPSSPPTPPSKTTHPRSSLRLTKRKPLLVRAAVASSLRTLLPRRRIAHRMLSSRM